MNFTDKIKLSKGKMDATLTAIGFEEDGMWIAWIPTVNISTYGDTQKEAINSLEDALNLFFEHIIKKKTINEVLNELGWKSKTKSKIKFNNSYTEDKYPEYKDLVQKAQYTEQLSLSY